jgi:dolichyl-phosphate beta-glucosyltransferase
MTDPAAPRLLSVVIPAYNEAHALGAHLSRILDWGAGRRGQVEVIVVDDGSTDSTEAVVRRVARHDPAVRVLRQETNRGKGAAVRRGLEAARGDIRGFTDADASTDIAELDRLLPCFASGAALVIGSRAKREVGVTVQAKLHRRLIGRSFNSILRLLLGLRTLDGVPVADTQCGFKWMTAEASSALLRHAFVDGFAFDVELLYLANRLGLPIAEIPVNWADHGSSSVNLLLDPPRMLTAAFQVVRRHRRVGR